MGGARDPGWSTDLVLLIFSAALLLVASPVRALWSHEDSAWWSPFAAWAVVLALAVLLTRAWIRHGD